MCLVDPTMCPLHALTYRPGLGSSVLGSGMLEGTRYLAIMGSLHTTKWVHRKITRESRWCLLVPGVGVLLYAQVVRVPTFPPAQGIVLFYSFLKKRKVGLGKLTILTL